MNKIDIDTITGRGLIFPIKLTPNGSAVIGGGLDLLRSSMKVIFSYEFGTRFFLYEFGLELRALLEEPNDDVLITLLEYRLSDQLLKWEPRINLLDISVERKPTGSGIIIKLQVGLKGTDIKDIFTFPYNNDL
jgi:phage baseplate assembly protein W